MEGGGDRHSRLAVNSPQAAAHNSLALVGASRLFRHVLKVVDAVATNDCVVLLEGESGTGKELLARRIHVRSRRIPSR